MRTRILFLTWLLALVCAGLCGAQACQAQARGETEGFEKMLEPGVGRELAGWRAAHYRDVRYALSVELAPGAEALRGTLETRVVLDATAGDLVFDWRVASKDGKRTGRVWDIEVNGRAVASADVREAQEHLVISRAALSVGENVVRMRFESPISATGSAAVTRYLDREDGAEYLYTLFVPSDASTAFPCFDQPDLKARFRLSVAAPKAWTVISNTNPETVTMNGAAPKLVRFRETEPISTYVFAFAAGDFAELADEASPLHTRMYVRRSQLARARKEQEEVFRLTRDGLAFFARYFDYKFPFPKYDLVILPEFPFRGMEHAGATFLREESILFPTEPTAGDRWSRADVMLHEAAHQWFGDTVTMRWFDDLWLKEGFATFMASKAVEALLPQYNAWKVFYQRTKPLAYDTDATKGTTPIWQEIQNLSAAKSAYGNIVYRKAPSMLRQAEFYLGAENFQRAVQIFLREHAFSNAEWADLVRAFERTSGEPLDAWADAWVKRRGMPDVRVAWGADRRGRIRRFTLRQTNVLGEGGAWPMRLRLLLAYDDGKAGDDAKNGKGKSDASQSGVPARFETLTVKLDATPETNVLAALGKRRPAYVFANYEDYGYGRFLLDDASRAYVLGHLGAVEDDFLRALLWGTLWDSVREAELAPLDYVELAVRYIARERDEVTVQAVLARLDTAFNRYLSDRERQRIAPRLEALLSAQTLKAETPGLRITYFRAYRQMATTRAAFDNLRALVSGQQSIPGVSLRSRDRFDILTAFVAAGHADAPLLLEELRRSVKTDDERRYLYAAQAAAPDAATKKRYFDAYLGDKSLAESWIEASMTTFNTPRHAALTLPYLDAALRELPVLKRTRKIFFVNGWLAAFIGGQCSPEAGQVVRDFLARQPSLDRDLRLKVLEAADGLERCVRIRAKYGDAKADGGARAPS